MDARLIEKLRKILAMTTSPVEAEAATAASLLRDLLQKHNLAMADLEKKGAAAPDVQERGHDLGKAAFKWKLRLADEIAEFYYCHPMVNHSAKTVNFIGRPDNVESLLMLYGWLIEQVKQIAAEERRKHQTETGEHVDPLRWQVNFGLGCVSRLARRMLELKEKQQAEMARNEDGDVVALTLHHDREISDYLEKTRGYRTDGQLTEDERRDREANQRGEEARKAWLARDPVGFYKEFPWRHPDAIAKEAERAALENAELRKRDERNRKARERRRGKVGYYEREKQLTPEQEREQEQAATARLSGIAAGDRVNLQPFLNGEAPSNAPKIGGKS